MGRRERQAQERAGGRASAAARWLPLSSAAALVALAVAGAPADGGLAESSRLAPAMVTATNYQFSPRAVTINQGETVTWANGGGSHNVVIEAESFEQPSPEAPPGAPNWPVTHQFNTPGTFTYFCRPHRTLGMTGTVTVNPAPPPPGSPPPGGTPPPGGGTPPPGEGTPPPGPPGAGKASTKVTLQVSDSTPSRGDRIRFFGSVRPEQDGRLVQLQRRARGRSFRTAARIKLSDAGASRSKFSKRLRVLKDGVFRARLPADSAHTASTSRTKRVDVR
jgi:plastocyanin